MSAGRVIAARLIGTRVFLSADDLARELEAIGALEIAASLRIKAAVFAQGEAMRQSKARAS